MTPAGVSPQKTDDLLPLLYERLRALAARHLRHEHAGHSLEPTAVVHEAYLRLVKKGPGSWSSRNHFFAAAATTMRRILVNRTVAGNRIKRGGLWRAIAFHENLVVADDRDENLMALAEALDRLAELYPAKAQVVELRFLGGLTVRETADLMGVSSRTVQRNWQFARAWLQREVCKGDEA